jgi:TPR repeat protein
MFARPNTFEKIFTRAKLPFAWFFLIVFIIYFETIFYGYTSLDDWLLLVNPHEFLKNPANIITAFKQNVLDWYYRPVLTISFITDTLIGRGTIAMYHFTNIALHFAAVCVLFVLFQKLGMQKNKAFCFVSLFAAYPAFTLAVAWVPGRNDTLLALFVFSAFLMLIKYLRGEKILHLILFAVFAFLALFTKETAAFMLIVFPTYILMFRDRKTNLKKAAFAVSVLYCIFVLWFLARGGVVNEVSAFVKIKTVVTGLERLVPVALQYLGKMVIPVNLSGMSRYENFSIYWGAAVLLCVLAAVPFVKIKDKKMFMFGLLWAALFFAPAIFHVSGVTLFISDHRLYLVIPGIILVLNALSLRLSKKFWICLWAVFFIFYGTLSMLNIKKFKDEDFFTSSVILQSNSAANSILAAHVYTAGGYYETAHYFYSKALEKAKYHVKSNQNLGFIYWVWQKPLQAKKHLITAVSKDDNSPDAWALLSMEAYSRNDIDAAVTYIEKALKYKPEERQYKEKLDYYLHLK